MPSSAARLASAVAHVRDGGLLAYPTETVYGLGADARSPAAVERLRRWKGRDAEQPISILVDAPSALAGLGLAETLVARRLAARFWPGPLTLVLAASPGRFAPGIARADGAIGVRCSPDPTASALASALGRAGVGPITATSLNRSGEPPVSDAGAARALLRRHPGPQLLLPLDEGRGSAGPEDPGASRRSGAQPSTVVDCSGPAFVVIRAGAIPEAALAKAVQPGEPSSP